jgi:hypothetical protein
MTGRDLDAFSFRGRLWHSGAGVVDARAPEKLSSSVKSLRRRRHRLPVTSITRRGLWSAAIRIVPAALVLVVISVHWGDRSDLPRDTFAYHQAAVAAAVGAGIYDPVPPPGPHEFRGIGDFHYLYPPPLAALLAPFSALSYRAFDRLWLLLDLLAFWVLAAALGKIARGSWSFDGTTRWAAAVVVPGPLLAIHFGNIELLVLALVTLGLALPRWAGFTLGLGAAFKVTPVWALFTLLLRRPPRIARGLAAAVVLAGGACLAVFGLAGTAALVTQWVTHVMPALSQGQFWGGSLAAIQQGGLLPRDYFANLSPSFLPVQLAVISGWWDYQGGPLPGPVRAYLTAFAIGAPALTGWLTSRRSPNVQAAAVLVAALFAAPIARPYGLPALLLLLATVRQERRERGTAVRSSPRPAAGNRAV